jgi:FHS family L-fucose permease-like MFS transporter
MAFSTIGPSRTTGDDGPLLPAGSGRVFALVTGLFFLWGIPNNLNDVLIRQFMKSFSISRFEAGLVQSAFYMGYFLLALPAGILMRHKGYKAGFVTGLVLFAAGCFLFYPAANSGTYAFFLGALFVVASGLAFLETAANPFIAQLGPSSNAARRLNLAQAFNPIGSILGVLIGTKFIFSGVELTAGQVQSMKAAGTYAAYTHGETLRIVAPYLILGVGAVVWAVMIIATKMPEVIRSKEDLTETRGNWRELLHKPQFLFSMAAQFMYVGAQVGTWSYFIQYAQDYAHAPEKTAGLLLTGTLAAFGIGRFVSAAIMSKVAASKLMLIYSIVNVGLLLVGIFMPGWVGLIAILLTSFCMSVMYPTIFALGLRDLGPNTNIGGSMIVMMIIGGAVLTPVMGLTGERLHSSALAYVIPLLGYIVVGAFSYYVSRASVADGALSAD